MAIIKTWGGDGLSAGAVTTASVGTGDSAFSSIQGSPTIVSAGDRPPRISIPDAAGSHNVRWWPLPGYPLSAVAARVYCTFGGFPGEATLIRAAVSGSEQWAVRARIDGRIGLYSDSAWKWAGVTSSTPADGSLVRIEVTAALGTVNVYVYSGHSMTLLASGGTTTALASGVDEIWFGKTAATQVSTGLTLDDMAVANAASLIGPSVATLPTPANFTLTPAAAPSVQLTAAWDAVSGASGYEIDMQRNDAGTWTPFLSDADVTSPLVLNTTHGLAAGATYRARVRALP